MARPPRLKEVPLDPRRRTALFLTMLATVVVRDLASAERADPDCHTLRPLRHRHQRAEEFPLSLEDKLALSPIVVQARLISRSHSILSISAMPEIIFATCRREIVSLRHCGFKSPDIRSASYNGLYFSSMRILRVMKGKVPKRLRRHVRLVFRQEDERHRPRPPCEHPVRFGVRSGRKYLMFLKRLGPARYAAVERPATWSKHARRVAKKILCEGCG